MDDVKALINEAQRAIAAALPEDEPDTIPDWCYETIIRAALAAPRYLRARGFSLGARPGPSGEDAGPSVVPSRSMAKRLKAQGVPAVAEQDAAPREREAPADLVALVTALRERRREWESLESCSSEKERALAAVKEVIDAMLAWRPASPGERSAIEVGDVLRTVSGHTWVVETVPLDWAKADIAAIYRDPLWRKP